MSAPGKVLIAGGYLILDHTQIGLALALSARIYVVVAADKSGSVDGGNVTVSSPQFLDTQWKYKCTVIDSTLHVKKYRPSLSI